MSENLDSFYLFANVVAMDSQQIRFGLGKRHVSDDHKTSLCRRSNVSDTAWIGPLLCETLISCVPCKAAFDRLKECESHRQLQFAPDDFYESPEYLDTVLHNN